MTNGEQRPDSERTVREMTPDGGDAEMTPDGGDGEMTPDGGDEETGERLADLLLEMLAFETSNPPGETAGLAEWVESYLSSLGVTTTWVVVDPAKPNLIARLPGERDEGLMCLGHLDTVPYVADEWEYDPLGERVGDRVYGRGATDMKGSIAAMLDAFGALATADASPPLTLELGLVSDEEIAGDAGLPAMLEDGAITAEACVIGETTCERGRHSVVVADRGSIWLTLEATGVGAHGSRPMRGVNAIDRLYAAVETIRDRFGTRRLEVDPAVDSIVDESVAYFEPVLGREAARTLFEYPTINLGSIEGGEAINTVPTSARARLDIRLAPGVETREVLASLRSCVDECEGVELTEVEWSIGSFEPENAPLVEAVSTVSAAVTDERIYRRSATGGGDAKTLRAAGISTVEFALGTDTVHAPDEYTTMEALTANREVFYSLPGAYADRRFRPPSEQ